MRKKLHSLYSYVRGNSRKEDSCCCLFAVLPECRFCYPCPHLGGVASLSSYPTVIAKSYPIRTVIQLSRYTRENIPQGVTFKTPIFVRFFKTFFKKLKVCSVAQKRPSLGRHFESLKKRLFMKLFYFR